MYLSASSPSLQTTTPARNLRQQITDDKLTYATSSINPRATQIFDLYNAPHCTYKPLSGVPEKSASKPVVITAKCTRTKINEINTIIKLNKLGREFADVSDCFKCLSNSAILTTDITNAITQNYGNRILADNIVRTSYKFSGEGNRIFDSAMTEVYFYNLMNKLYDYNISQHLIYNINSRIYKPDELLGTPPNRNKELEADFKKMFFPALEKLMKPIPENQYFIEVNSNTTPHIFKFGQFIKHLLDNVTSSKFSIELDENDAFIILSILMTQLLYTLQCFELIGFNHNDLHYENILVFCDDDEIYTKYYEYKKNPDKCRYFEYEYIDESGKYHKMKLPDIGFDVKIYDYDISSKFARYNSVDNKGKLSASANKTKISNKNSNNKFKTPVKGTRKNTRSNKTSTNFYGDIDKFFRQDGKRDFELISSKLPSYITNKSYFLSQTDNTFTHDKFKVITVLMNIINERPEFAGLLDRFARIFYRDDDKDINVFEEVYAKRFVKIGSNGTGIYKPSRDVINLKYDSPIFKLMAYIPPIPSYGLLKYEEIPRDGEYNINIVYSVPIVVVIPRARNNGKPMAEKQYYKLDVKKIFRHSADIFTRITDEIMSIHRNTPGASASSSTNEANSEYSIKRVEIARSFTVRNIAKFGYDIFTPIDEDIEISEPGVVKSMISPIKMNSINSPSRGVIITPIKEGKRYYNVANGSPVQLPKSKFANTKGNKTQTQTQILNSPPATSSNSQEY
jgi:hypothetical protein